MRVLTETNVRDGPPPEYWGLTLACTGTGFQGQRVRGNGDQDPLWPWPLIVWPLQVTYNYTEEHKVKSFQTYRTLSFSTQAFHTLGICNFDSHRPADPNPNPNT